MSDRKSFDHIAIGIALGIGLHPVAIIVAMVVLADRVLKGYDSLAPIVFFGTTQLVLTLPAAALLWHWGVRRTARGVLLIAAISFSLNSLCWALQFANR